LPSQQGGELIDLPSDEQARNDGAAAEIISQKFEVHGELSFGLLEIVGTQFAFGKNVEYIEGLSSVFRFKKWIRTRVFRRASAARARSNKSHSQ
jgi:hypothetical protein